MKPRVVLDTNIFISAILYGGNPRKVVELAIFEDVEVYISLQLVDELSRVLRDKFTLGSVEIDKIISEIKDFAEIVTPRVTLQVVEKDPPDDRVLEYAVAAKADFIISGDKHLLDLGNFREIKIVGPAEFLEIRDKN